MPPSPHQIKLVTVVRLHMQTTDDSGEVFDTETWCAYAAGLDAVKLWKRDHPALAALLKRHEIISPRVRTREELAETEDRKVRLPVGPTGRFGRILIRDFSLERAGEGI